MIKKLFSLISIILLTTIGIFFICLNKDLLNTSAYAQTIIIEKEFDEPIASMIANDLNVKKDEPFDISRFNNIENLDFSNAKKPPSLKGFQFFKSLKILKLNNVAMVYLDPYIFQISNLKELHLVNNRIFNLPLELARLKDLRVLNLAENYLPPNYMFQIQAKKIPITHLNMVKKGVIDDTQFNISIFKYFEKLVEQDNMFLPIRNFKELIEDGLNNETTDTLSNTAFKYLYLNPDPNNRTTKICLLTKEIEDEKGNKLTNTDLEKFFNADYSVKEEKVIYANVYLDIIKESPNINNNDDLELLKDHGQDFILKPYYDNLAKNATANKIKFYLLPQGKTLLCSSILNQKYTGKQIMPIIKNLKFINEENIVKSIQNKDCDFSYSNNINIGEATIHVSYEYEPDKFVKKDIKFNIAKDGDIQKIHLGLVFNDKVYDGTNKTDNFKVTPLDEEEDEIDDFEVFLNENYSTIVQSVLSGKDVGEVNVTVSGIENIKQACTYVLPESNSSNNDIVNENYNITETALVTKKIHILPAYPNVISLPQVTLKKPTKLSEIKLTGGKIDGINSTQSNITNLIVNETNLQGKWQWISDENTVVNKSGYFKAEFIPNSKNYSSVEVDIKIDVVAAAKPAEPVKPAAKPAAKPDAKPAAPAAKPAAKPAAPAAKPAAPAAKPAAPAAKPAAPAAEKSNINSNNKNKNLINLNNKTDANKLSNDSNIDSSNQPIIYNDNILDSDDIDAQEELPQTGGNIYKYVGLIFIILGIACLTSLKLLKAKDQK